MRAYSRDLRLRVLNAYLNEEGSQREIARRFDVSRGFVCKLLQRYRETGDVGVRRGGGGRRRKIGRETSDVLREIVDQHPTATLSELCGLLRARTETAVSISTMHRAVKALPLR
jgi:transposase